MIASLCSQPVRRDRRSVGAGRRSATKVHPPFSAPTPSRKTAPPPWVMPRAPRPPADRGDETMSDAPRPSVDPATRRRRQLRVAAALAHLHVRTVLVPPTSARRRQRVQICGAARILTALGVRVRVVGPATPWPRHRPCRLVVADDAGWLGGLALLTSVPRTTLGWRDVCARVLPGARRSVAEPPPTPTPSRARSRSGSAPTVSCSTDRRGPSPRSSASTSSSSRCTCCPRSTSPSPPPAARAGRLTPSG